MALIIKCLGSLIIFAGIAVIFNPSGFYEWIESSLDKQWMYVAAIVLRASLGILLIVTAKHSRFPFPIKVIGYITVLAAIVLMCIGQVRFQEFISSMMDTIQPFAWISGVIAAIAGIFLIYSFTNNMQRE